MADSLKNAIDDAMCQSYQTRGSRKIDKGIDEWSYAETAAFFRFSNYFRDQYKGGTVVSQLNYKSIATPSDTQVQIILDAMDVYFRNWWSPKNPNREGGARKPDGLGIAPGGKVIEIIEVKPNTDKYYNDGVNQLNEMIDKIRDGVKRYVREQEYAQTQTLSLDTMAMIVKGSPWKPSGRELIEPLVEPDEIAWICFRPTLRKRGDGTKPVDGVILYEIHYISKPQGKSQRQLLPKDLLPPEVARRLAEAHAKRIRSKTLQLVPWAKDYTRANALDAAKLRDLLAVVGLVAAVAVIALIIIETAPVSLAAATVVETTGIDVAASTAAGTVVETTGTNVGLRIAASQYEAAQTAQALLDAAAAEREAAAVEELIKAYQSAPGILRVPQ